MIRSLFNTNKKSLLSLLLALAMVFSFVGLSSPALADGPGPDAYGVPTDSFTFNMFNSDFTPITNQTITEESVSSSLSLNHYSILKRKAGSSIEYYTGLGVSLKSLISQNLPTGKTIADIDKIAVTCNDAPTNLTVIYDSNDPNTVSPTTFFDGSRKFYDSNNVGTVVETTLNFKSGAGIITSVSDPNLVTTDTVRFHTGQTSTTDANMPLNLKWVKDITVVLK